MELTEELVNQITPPPPKPDGKGTQAFYRDSTLTGFGLRVSSGGIKSYILERRIRGKVKRITLGHCDKMAFSRAQARAKKLIKEVERENAPRIIYGNIVETDISLLTAYKAYLKTHHNLNDLTLADYQRSIDGPLKEWQSTPVNEITVAMVLDKHKIHGQKFPARSNNAMRLLRAIMNFVRWNMRTKDHQAVINSNPVDTLSKRNLWYPSHTHTAKSGIQKQNLKSWWEASHKLKKSTTKEYFHFLLLSGLPHKLVSQLKFSDINFDNKTIEFTDKEQKIFTLPISKYLTDSIYKRPKRIFDDRSYIFPGLTQTSPISNPRTAIKKITEYSGVRFGLKDLHKTFLNLAQQSYPEDIDLKLMQNLYNDLSIPLSEDAINKLRDIQERVFLNTHFIIGGSK